MSRWAWADVDVSAISHNVRTLSAIVTPAEVWAVVKADGYGHGALAAAKAALDGGASRLCVALVQEGLALRAGGIDAPIVVFSEQPADQLAAAVAAGLQLTVYSEAAIDALAALAPGHPVHLDVDTGMRRVGCQPHQALALAQRVQQRGLTLHATSTHFAVADEPDDPYTSWQLERFDAVLSDMASAGIDPGVVHVANSAGALAHPAARRHAVRAGIVLYGLLPGPGVAEWCTPFRPALSLRARVSMVKRVQSGDRISYGLRHRFVADTTVGTVPVGYADGVPRRLFECGGSVLVGGVRRPIVGVVTMDQLMVDCGDHPVAVGDEAVLLGRQGDETITADEWAALLGTIGYEVVCGISARVPRRTIA